MRLKDMIYVREVARYNNFSKASKTLYVSQPALSKAIMQLEKELGVTLFSRSSTSVSLTEAGRIFLEEADKILELTDGLKLKMMNLSKPNSTILKIGSAQFYNKYFMPHVIPEFKKLYPDVSIEITEGVSSVNEMRLLDNEIDLAVIPLPMSSSDLKYDLVYSEKIVFAYCSANEKLKTLYDEAIGGESFDLSLFKDVPFILLKDGFKMRLLSEAICREFGFSPNIILKPENNDTVNSLINQDFGVSFLPSFIEKYNNVSYVELASANAARSIVAAYNPNHPDMKMLKNFIECLRKTINSHPKFKNK